MKVPTPRKLKSGSWFIQLRLNGVSVPVTATTKSACIKQAQLIKAEHAAGKHDVQKVDDTLGQMIDSYIAKYEADLSPSTIRGYTISRKNRFQNYMDIPFKSVKDWQQVINEELQAVSRKTVKNGWGTVTAALNDRRIPVPHVKFPKKRSSPDLSFLEPEEIPLFLKAVEGDSAELEILLELHSLRLSEAMYAVRNNMFDIKHGIIKVKGAIVPDKHNKSVEKDTTKTAKSERSVDIMIPRLLELLKQYTNGKLEIPTHSDTTILRHVHKACAKAGVTDVTNHGLRRTFASLGYSLGISEKALMDMGGWEDQATMHNIYVKLASRDKSRAKSKMAEFYNPKSRREQALEALCALRGKYSDVVDLEPVFSAIDNIVNANGKC